MRALEFIFEAKGDKIFSPSQWPKMLPLLIQGIQKDTSIEYKPPMNYKKGDELEADDINNIKKVASELIKMDPTRNGAYEIPIVKWYAKGQFFAGEDGDTVYTLLTNYDSLKKRNKLKPEFKDITTLDMNKTSKEVGDIIRKDKEAELAAQRDLATSKGETVGLDRGELIIDEGAFKVFHPLNSDQGRNVCKMPSNAVYAQTVKWGDGGTGTQWCTASENQFKHYSSRGPLYVIIVNDDQPSMRSFQFHYETNSFMNEQDRNLTDEDIKFLSQYPGYTKFLNMMIKKHYGELFKK